LDGLNKFDWRTERFYRYKNNPDDTNSISYNLIYSIYEDKSGTLWVGTDNGINKYNREEDNFTVFKKASSGSNHNSLNSFICIEEDQKANIWFGTWEGLTCLLKDGSVLHKQLPEHEKIKTLFYNEISAIREDHEGNLWIGTKGKGLYKYNPSEDKFINYSTKPDDQFSISDNFVNTIFQDKLNNLWIGTNNGLNKFDWGKNRFTRLFNDPLKPLSISSNEILSIFEDQTGILWIGSSGGVSKLNQTVSNFNYYKADNSETGLSNNYVNSIFKNKKGEIWVGTRRGLNKIKHSGSGRNRIEWYLNDPVNTNSLNDNYVWSVIEDHLGYVWIGTDGGGLNRYNPATGEFKIFTPDVNDPESISNNGVISLCEDNKGNIWAGTWWGFNLFDRKKEKFLKYTDKFEYNVIWVIYQDSKGMLWFGSDGSGISKYNPHTNAFTNFKNESENLPPEKQTGPANYSQTTKISGNRVISIFESRDGIMWFGTINGLNSYDRTTNKFRVYNKENGLLSNSINGILEDDKGNLWISTDKSISKLNRKTGLFVNFTKRSGLKNVEFSPRAAVKAANGDFIFGSKGGLTFFNPSDIKDEYFTAPIVFTDLKIYNQSVLISDDGILKESITGSAGINIPSGNDVITLEFALLDYYSTKDNKFLYMLAGFDPEWNDVGKRNSATYTNLPPGKYTFIVKSTNSSILGNAKEASLKINIIPAFHQTIWFKIVLAAGGLIITFVIINSRTRTMKNRNKILEKLVAEHTKDLDKTISELSQEIIERKKADEKVQTSLKEKEILLKEIHHRVKNNLQVISSLLYLNSKKIKDKETLGMFKVSQNRVKSIALVHERLYQSNDLSKIDFREYVQKLTKDLFRSYAVNQSIIKLDINIDDIFINIDTAVPCALIINELISNSLKYAFPNYEAENKQGLIKISFIHSENGENILMVSDNGIGIPEDFNEKKNNSLGLQLVETLVAQLEAKLKIYSSLGTEFRIKLKGSN
jgi:two-component sensor histidine kinase/ligand-binding sensor domain-containing protein